MGTVKAYTWKELIEQAEIAENQLKSLRPPKVGGGSSTKAMTRVNLPIHKHWKYMEELDQKKVTRTGLQSIETILLQR